MMTTRHIAAATAALVAGILTSTGNAAQLAAYQGTHCYSTLDQDEFTDEKRASLACVENWGISETQYVIIYCDHGAVKRIAYGESPRWLMFDDVVTVKHRHGTNTAQTADGLVLDAEWVVIDDASPNGVPAQFARSIADQLKLTWQVQDEDVVTITPDEMDAQAHAKFTEYCAQTTE